MAYTLPLEEMDTAEKLRLMEALWADLSKEPASVPVPDWHVEILSEREESANKGESVFSDWDEAKDRLRRKTR